MTDKGRIEAVARWPYKPKRSMFWTREEFWQALQVWLLVKELRDMGASAERCRALLEEENGGFVAGWEFLFEGPKARGER